MKEYMGILSDKDYKLMKIETKAVRKKISEDFKKREKGWKE